MTSEKAFCPPPEVTAPPKSRHRQLLSRRMFMKASERKASDPQLFDLEETCAPFMHTNPRPMTHPAAVLGRIFSAIFFFLPRFFGTILTLVFPIPIYWLIYLGQDRTEPLCGWRASLFSAVLRAQCRLGLLCFGFWHVKVENVHPRPAETHPCAPIIANHSSFIDILALIYVHGAAGFVAKEGVGRTPVLGLFSDGISSIYVSRTSPESRRATASVIAARATGEARRKDGRPLPVTIFPEGGTTNGRNLMTFRSGAFRPGVPVRPVLISYPARTWSLEWESLSMMYWLLSAMVQPWNSLVVRELPAYTPSEVEKAQPNIYADNVRRCMAAADGRGVTDLGVRQKLIFLCHLHGGAFDDFKALWNANDLGQAQRHALDAARAEVEAEAGVGASWPLVLQEDGTYVRQWPEIDDLTAERASAASMTGSEPISAPAGDVAVATFD